MMKRALFSLLLLLAFSRAGLASDGAFRHYTTRDGLSSNTVQALIQDRAGLIWMGTASGLDSFDGKEFIHHAFPAGEDDYVRQLFQATDGTLWIGTESAVFRYNMTIFPERVSAIPEALVTGFAEDRDGAVWIAVWSKGVYRYADGVFTQFLDGHLVEGLLVDRDGRLWVADQSEPLGLSLYNAASRSFSAPNLAFQDCRPTRICAMDVDEEGDLWLGTWDLGIYRLETDTRTVFPAVPPGDGLDHVHFLTHESPLHLLVGSDDGLLSVNPLTGEQTHYRNDRSDPASLSSKFVYPIVRDHEGGLWIGTYYGGVNYLPPTAGQFSSVSLSDLVKGNEDFIVSCLCEDPDGTVWIGSDNGGLFRYDPVRKTAVRLPGVFSTLNVHALRRQGEYLWIGTYSQNLFRLHVRTGAVRQFGAADGLGDPAPMPCSWTRMGHSGPGRKTAPAVSIRPWTALSRNGIKRPGSETLRKMIPDPCGLPPPRTVSCSGLLTAPGRNGRPDRAVFPPTRSTFCCPPRMASMPAPKRGWSSCGMERSPR